MNLELNLVNILVRPFGLVESCLLIKKNPFSIPVSRVGFSVVENYSMVYMGRVFLRFSDLSPISVLCFFFSEDALLLCWPQTTGVPPVVCVFNMWSIEIPTTTGHWLIIPHIMLSFKVIPIKTTPCDCLLFRWLWPLGYEMKAVLF